MAKTGRNIIIGIVILILLLLIGGGIFWFSRLASKGGVTDVTSESEDGFAKLSATFYDFSGDEITPGITQALIGGTNKRTHVTFKLDATNTGNVQLTDVGVSSPNPNMNGAFNNMGTLSTLDISASVSLGGSDQSCSNVGGTVCDGLGSGGCDANEECCPGNICAVQLDQYAVGTSANNVDFSISLQGDFLNAQGVSQTTTSDAVTLTYDIREETCSEGTTINTCVFGRTGLDSDKPNYCNFVEGSVPSIIEKASVCGCPTGQEPSGETCVSLTCADGTNVGQCSVLTNEDNFGAYMFCLPSQTFEPHCNECGATVDALGDAATGCSSGTDPSSAVYITRAGGLSGSLTE